MSGKLGAELADYRVVIAVLKAVAHDKRVRVGLAEQIFYFIYLVSRVDGDQHRADLGRRPEGDIPLRKVCRPYRNMVAALHAQRDKRTGKTVDIAAELRVGAGIVAFGKAEGVLVGKRLAHAVEKLRKGQVDQHILLPDISARAAQIGDKRVRCRAPAEECRHIVYIMRKHYARILQVGSPLLHPFQRQISLVIDAFECADDIRNGHIAFAHQAVLHGSVLTNAVLYVNIGDIHPEVLHGFFGRFGAEAVGMVNIPKRLDRITFGAVEQRLQACGIAVNTVCFDQKRYACFLCRRYERFELRKDFFIVDIVAGVYHVVAENTDKSAADPACGGDVFADKHGVFRRAVVICKAGAGGKAGNREPQRGKLFRGIHNVVGRKRGDVSSVGKIVAEPADFDPVEPEVGCHCADIAEAVSGAGERGERELHCVCSFA